MERLADQRAMDSSAGSGAFRSLIDRLRMAARRAPAVDVCECARGMKVSIEVAITADRLTAHVANSEVTFDEPNVVALISKDGTDLIEGIGSDAHEIPGARVAPGVSIDAFDPRISAGVIYHVGIVMWDRLRQGWRGHLAILDHVEVHVSIERFDELTRAAKNMLIRAMPHHPSVTWSFNGGNADPSPQLPLVP